MLKQEEERLQKEENKLKTEIEQLKQEREKLDLEAEPYKKDYAKWKPDIDKKEILDALNRFKDCLEKGEKDAIKQAAFMLRHKIFYSELYPAFQEGLTLQKDAAAFILVILDVIGWDPIKFNYIRGGRSSSENGELEMRISLQEKGIIK